MACYRCRGLSVLAPSALKQIRKTLMKAYDLCPPGRYSEMEEFRNAIDLLDMAEFTGRKA